MLIMAPSGALDSGRDGLFAEGWVVLMKREEPPWDAELALRGALPAVPLFLPDSLCLCEKN